MPQYKASHEMDGRKRKEEQHAAFGAVPMQPPMPPFPQQQQPNGMRPNGPIPAYGAPPPIPAYNGGQVAVPPPVGVFNGPPPPTMAAAHGYPGPQQQPPPPQMGGYGAAGPGPSGMAAGMGMGGGGGFRPPPPPPHGGHNHHHNRSYAAPGPPTAGRGMQPRRMGPGGGAGQYEGMRQGPSWNPNLPARPSGGPPAKVNLKDMLKRQR